MATMITPLGQRIDLGPSTFGKQGSGTVMDPCTALREAQRSGVTNALVLESLKQKCAAMALTTARAGAAIVAPSAPAVASSQPVGYPEPKEEGISPVAIAAGVAGLGVAALLVYKLTRKRR